MKATLEFNLPEEQEEFKTAAKAGETMSVVEDVLNYIRSRLKYANLPETSTEELREIRSRLSAVFL